MNHRCGVECESIHKNIIAKLILTVLEGRQIEPPSKPRSAQFDGSSPISIRHPVYDNQKSEPKSSINKWFHLGLEEDEQTRREIKECNRRWEIPYKIDIILDIQPLLQWKQQEPAQKPFLKLKKTQTGEAVEVDLDFWKNNAEGGILLESWTISFEDSVNHNVDLTELYKRTILLHRALYGLMRQLPAWYLVKRARMDRAYVSRPYNLIHRISPLDNRIKSTALPLDSSIPGFEAYEPSSKIDLPLLMTSHGTLRVSLEHRSQFVVEFGGYDLLDPVPLKEEEGPQSFEDIELDLKNWASPVSISNKTQRISKATSVSSSPRTTKLGLGTSLPKRTTSLGNITLPKSPEEQQESSLRERAKSFQSVVEIPSASSTSNSMRTSTLLNPSVLIDTAITQFIKQCDNHPFLESLPSQNLPKDSSLTKRLESLQEQAHSDLELWLSNFRAVESLMAPTESQITRTTSAQTTLPLVKEEGYSPSIGDDDLMFPLL